VSTVGSSAFSGCGGLAEVNIAEGVTTISSSAFSACTSLTNLDIPDSVITIGGSAFNDCTALTRISVGKGVTAFSPSAFGGCPNLSDVDVDEDNPAFSSLDGVLFNKDKTTLLWFPRTKTGAYTIPSSVTLIAAEAFAGCIGLTEVSLPDGLVWIGSEAFRGCGGLTQLTIPDLVFSISTDAFTDCTGLTSVVIGDAVQFPPKFIGCTSLRSVTYGTGTWAISELPAGITSLHVDPANTYFSSVDGVVFNPDRTMLVRCPEARAGSYAIPASVTTIARDAFRDCSQLTEITIGNGVTSIYASAFAGCSGLASMALPASITEIASELFSGCTKLATIAIPTSVTHIGALAFSGCEGLTGISLPESLTSIEGSTFQGCSGLTEIHLPASVSSIETAAFRDCTGLTAINLPAGLTSIGWNAFFNCSQLRELDLPASVVEIKDYAFTKCDRMENLNVAPGNTVFQSIDGVVFSNNLTKLRFFPLGRGGHYSIPEGTVRIDQRAFYECNHIESVTFPASVTYIEDYALYACLALTTVEIEGDLLPTLGKDIFAGCTSLRNVNLGSAMTFIPDGMFENCINLRNVTIPASVTFIDYSAFKGCTNLKGFYFEGDQPRNRHGSIVDAGDARIYFLSGASGWGPTWRSLQTSLWTTAPPIATTAVDIQAENIGLTWRTSNIPGSNYAVESSTDGRSWTAVPGLENLPVPYASIPRDPSGERLFLRARERSP